MILSRATLWGGAVDRNRKTTLLAGQLFWRMGRCPRTMPEDVASKPRMLETPYASNSWALGPWALGPMPWAGPQRCAARHKRARRCGTQPRIDAAPRLRLAAHLWGPAQGMGPRAHGPRAPELEAYGVSSIRGFEATSSGNVLKHMCFLEA